MRRAGAFWVVSLIHLLLPLRGKSDMCYVPCGDSNENRRHISRMFHPRAGTATYMTTLNFHNYPEEEFSFVPCYRGDHGSLASELGFEPDILDM